MKKILTLVVLTLILSCSTNETIEQETTSFPTDISLPAEPISVGDILTINGSGFSENENYIVTFTGDALGIINEISANSLKVEVPENALSGDITLSFNNITQVIGSLVIEDNSNTENVYLYYESQGFIVKLDIETGELEVTRDGIANGGDTIGAVYNSQTNEYIVFFNNTDPNYIVIDLNTGEPTFHAIDPSFSLIVGDGTDVFSAPVIDDNGKVYLIYERLSSLVELNIETGELNLISDGFNGGDILGAIFNSQTNEYIALYNNTDPNYIKLNLTTLELSFEPIDPSFSFIIGDGTDVFSAPVIDNNGKVYLIYERLSSLVELNIETGELNLISDGFNGGDILGAIYSPKTNEYIAFFNNTDPNYIKLNLTSLELSFKPIDPSFSFITGDGTDVFSAPIISAN